MVRRLSECAPGAFIRRTSILRPGFPAPARVRGRIAAYARRAKNVLIHLETGRTLRIQLGMTGHIYWIADPGAPPRFARVLFELEDGHALVFEDSRVFGSITLAPTAALPAIFAEYGPEPLDPAFTWRGLKEAAARASGPVKPFLLDQSRVAGLGNIWAAESLFRARLHPARRVPSINDPEWRALHAAIRRTLSRAIENTFKVTRHPANFPEADLLWLNVYGREGKPCRACRTPVRRETQAGRSTFYCAHCQR